MGRGIAYPYEYFMLVDDTEWDELDSEDFVNDVLHLLNLKNYGNYSHSGRDTVHIGETKEIEDEVFIGIDFSGGLPALIAEYRYTEEEEFEEDFDPEEDTYEAYRDRIEEKITKMFNRLIDLFDEEAFRYPTSAWTSGAYTSEKKYR
jgi:hypothetical protein